MKPKKACSVFVKSEEELAKFKKKYKMTHVKDIFFHNDKLELIMEKPIQFKKVNRRTNVLIASQINSYAKM